jgi:hypothetical protein
VGLADLDVGKAEVDGDPAALLLFQAVGVNASQGFDERGFAVIDMTGCADDDVMDAQSVPSLRSGFRLRAPAALTPAKRLNLPWSI